MKTVQYDEHFSSSNAAVNILHKIATGYNVYGGP